MPDTVELSLAALPEIMDNRVHDRADAVPAGAGLMSEAKIDHPVWGTADKALLARLIERGRAGDLGAMEALYEMFKGPVFGLQYRHISNREAAEDLLQDVFLKVFTHLREVRDPETFPGWVYRIALNTCYSYLRQKKAQAGRDVSLTDLEARIVDDGPEKVEKDLKGPLETAIRALPAGLRSVFVLHDIQGFKHEEISRLLKCSVGTSKSQLFKARMKLRALLKDRQVV
jgi:RNA polymerase sigma-70 factor (ECF subfamily)